MELFKTTGVVDETVLKGVAKAGISKSGIRVSILYFVGCIIFILMKRYMLAGIFFVLDLLLVYWYFVIPEKITIKRNLHNMEEFSGASGYQYTTWLDEEGIVIQNLTNHAEGKIRYSHLKRVFETEDILVMQTKNKQFVPIFKSGLSPEEIEEAAAFLKEKNSKIKIKRLKRT